ncbi:hypothetical protein STEG23_011707, partial [Scotinomys teguina]
MASGDSRTLRHQHDIKRQSRPLMCACLNRKPSKRALSEWDKDAEVGFQQLMASGRGVGVATWLVAYGSTLFHYM